MPRLLARALLNPLPFAFALALLARVWVILRFPNSYAFDAWQRWAGRDHLLVQDWLPGTQAVIAGVAALGGGVQLTRLALAIVTALGIGAGAHAAWRIGGRHSAWIFGALVGFGPALVWTSQLYQEGAYAAVFLAGLALAVEAAAAAPGSRRATWLLVGADLVVGALPLVRYEGWPVVFAWLAWRHDPTSLRALWGELVWAGVKLAGAKGYYPSTVDYFEDWRHIGPHFDASRWLTQLLWLGELLTRSGGLALLVVGLAGAGMCWRARGMPYLAFALGVQVVATLGWVAGLESATQRMLVLPVLLAALPAAVGGGELWARVPRLRSLISAALILWVGFGLYVAADTVDRERARVRPELMALGRMHACADCTWWVIPREGLGSQGRDDGCEIIQGMTRLRHGEHFWCAPWLADRPAAEQARDRDGTSGVVRWSATDRQNGQYVVEVTRPRTPGSTGADAPGAAGAAAPDAPARSASPEDSRAPSDTRGATGPADESAGTPELPSASVAPRGAAAKAGVRPPARP